MNRERAMEQRRPMQAQEAKTAFGGKKPAVEKQGAPGLKKHKKKLPGGLIASLVLVLLVAGAGAAVYFDLGGIKPVVAEALGLQNQTAVEAAAFQKRSGEIEKKEAEVQAAEGNLKNAQAGLTRKETELDEREAKLDQREAELEEQESALEGKKADMEKTVKTFETMDPARAAGIISKLKNAAEMTKILSNLSGKAVAGILENMDPKLAAEVLAEMIE